MKEAIPSSETSVITRATRRHISEVGVLLMVGVSLQILSIYVMTDLVKSSCIQEGFLGSTGKNPEYSNVASVAVNAEHFAYHG
jgi:hypothetical protein